MSLYQSVDRDTECQVCKSATALFTCNTCGLSVCIGCECRCDDGDES